MAVKSLDQIDLKGKRVLVRVDFNVPMNDAGEITDDSRIRAALPTIQTLLENQCKMTLMSHLGRPKGQVNPKYSMAPVATYLAKLLEQPVHLVTDFSDGGQHATVQLLENLRFSPGETKNDAAFAKTLAAYGEVYINDAFGAAHRAHASIAAVAELFSVKAAGHLLTKELHYLKDALKAPERPFVAILGGSKISDKLKLIDNLLDKVDRLIIGGGMSYTFLKARGLEVGTSLVENDFLEEAKALEAKCEAKGVALTLPLDHLVAAEFKADAAAEITLDAAIPEGYMGLDIGPETINLYATHVREAKTAVWNGPMGVFEWETFATGTISVAEAMAENGGLTVIGGGDSVAAVNKVGLQAAMTHISTGGGASLELLGGHDLPGVVALEVGE
ncbi:Phosphoglycerate kinase [Acanthopleuribacter pedis]|uniref:Phosphoglycerate kinase n=2 Tax=Acanthopleuribacter pedis TaxID=442870 RepID=A0A8J7QEL6_9BACT|nr:phosphoglycerate kinase [Acanthopleuribacter pedis]MBO1322839.1 phosphoglycerate kinase [Acanthopleuribacter pedis]